MNQEKKKIEEITKYANEGETLVIRGGLNVIKANDESWLQDNIFK